jgi:hypothetical protein
MLLTFVPDLSPPLMGLLGRLVLGLAGQGGFFLRIMLIKNCTNKRRGVRLWGGDVHRIIRVCVHQPPSL